MSATPDPAAVQTMIDEAAIAKLQNRYMFAIDWRDGEVMSSLFVEDCVLAWPEGKAEGRERIRGMFSPNPNFPLTGFVRHVVANQVIEVTGDTARARAYWWDFDKKVGAGEDGKDLSYVLAYGHYEDDLVRTSEGWRFKQRTVYNQSNPGAEPPKVNPCW
jgi:ketosteroid isomerase-like protein